MKAGVAFVFWGYAVICGMSPTDWRILLGGIAVAAMTLIASDDSSGPHLH